MRLAVTAPPGWQPQKRDLITLLVRGDAARPTAVAEIPAIASVPDSSESWVRLTLGRDLAPPAQLRVERTEELAGRDGWRAQILICAVVGTAEQPIEHRLGVYLRLLDDLGVCVMVRATTAADLDAALVELRPHLAIAAPDWRADAEVAAISQLYEP